MLAVCAAVVAGAVTMAAGAVPPDTAIAFPADYRNWTHVKTTLVGAQHPSFASNGGYHHFYANARAIEGYTTGVFPDGSIVIDDGLEAIDKGGVSVEGPRRRVAVMVKDSRRFGASRGWGFEVFMRDTQEGSLSAEGKAECLACHQRAPRDLVYSTFRK